MWMALIKCYWRVSLFKESPANTPYSLLLLGMLAVFFGFLISLQWMMTDAMGGSVLGPSLFGAFALLLSYGLYTLALLAAFGLSCRVVQTLTCLLAGHALVHLCAFPLLIMAPWLDESTAIQPLALLVATVYLILTFVLTIWQFMVTAYIYKHALGVDYFPAVLASFGLLACNVLIVSFG